MNMTDQTLSWLPSIPYSPAQQGRWSPVTSTLNWCEEDYYATIYAAEIVNTLTNLLFMYLAFKGIYNCVQNGHDRIFLITFVGYLLVGTGSFFFHATLKYPMQLVDELSMIYTTCLMNYATFSYGKSKRFSVAVAVSLLTLCIGITLYYHYVQDPVFHQVAYALLTAALLFRSFWVMEVNMRPRFKSDDRPLQNGHNGSALAEQKREDRRDKKILNQMWSMIAIGLGIFLGGFAIWNLDNEFCPTLRRWRRRVGLPWGILLEGHGWWHVMTGIGAYYYIVWGIWLRHCLNDRQDEFELIWPSLAQMPAVVKRRKPLANGYQNGPAKKKK